MRRYARDTVIKGAVVAGFRLKKLDSLACFWQKPKHRIKGCRISPCKLLDSHLKFAVASGRRS